MVERVKGCLSHPVVLRRHNYFAKFRHQFQLRDMVSVSFNGVVTALFNSEDPGPSYIICVLQMCTITRIYCPHFTLCVRHLCHTMQFNKLSPSSYHKQTEAEQVEFKASSRPYREADHEL